MGKSPQEGSSLTSRTFLCALSFWRLATGDGVAAGGFRQAALSIGLGGHHHCRFENGYLPVRDADLRTVTILDTRGGVVGSFRPAPPDTAVWACRIWRLRRTEL
jgi:hypothetical protein